MESRPSGRLDALNSRSLQPKPDVRWARDNHPDFRVGKTGLLEASKETSRLGQSEHATNPAPQSSPQSMLRPFSAEEEQNYEPYDAASRIGGRGKAIIEANISKSFESMAGPMDRTTMNQSEGKKQQSSIAHRDHTSAQTLGEGSGAYALRSQKHPAPFYCTLCPKRFTRAYYLRSHLRTHTDERPIICSHCGKAFARQHDRIRHERVHSRPTRKERGLSQSDYNDDTLFKPPPDIQIGIAPQEASLNATCSALYVRYTISQDMTIEDHESAKHRLLAIEDRGTGQQPYTRNHVGGENPDGANGMYHQYSSAPRPISSGPGTNSGKATPDWPVSSRLRSLPSLLISPSQSRFNSIRLGNKKSEPLSAPPKPHLL